MGSPDTGRILFGIQTPTEMVNLELMALSATRSAGLNDRRKACHYLAEHHWALQKQPVQMMYVTECPQRWRLVPPRIFMPQTRKKYCYSLLEDLSANRTRNGQSRK